MTFRPARDFLFNSLVATIGVAIAESSVYSVFQPKTLDEAYLKEIILSGVIAFALGYIVYFKWEFRTAFWVWLIGLSTFGWRVALGSPHAGDIEELMKTTTLTFVSVRAVFYSLGALCCSCWLTWRRERSAEYSQSGLATHQPRLRPRSEAPVQSLPESQAPEKQ